MKTIVQYLLIRAVCSGPSINSNRLQGAEITHLENRCNRPINLWTNSYLILILYLWNWFYRWFVIWFYPRSVIGKRIALFKPWNWICIHGSEKHSISISESYLGPCPETNVQHNGLPILAIPYKVVHHFFLYKCYIPSYGIFVAEVVRSSLCSGGISVDES